MNVRHDPGALERKQTWAAERSLVECHPSALVHPLDWLRGCRGGPRYEHRRADDFHGSWFDHGTYWKPAGAHVSVIEGRLLVGRPYQLRDADWRQLLDAIGEGYVIDVEAESPAWHCESRTMWVIVWHPDPSGPAPDLGRLVSGPGLMPERTKREIQGGGIPLGII